MITLNKFIKIFNFVSSKKTIVSSIILDLIIRVKNFELTNIEKCSVIN